MVEAVPVRDQGVSHAGQVQQPIPVGVVTGQPRHLQRQHDPDLPEADLGRQLGEPRPALGRGSADPLVLVDDPDRAARPPQRHRLGHQVVLAGRGLPVALELGQRRLTDIDDRCPLPVGGAHFRGVTHRRPLSSSSWRRGRSAGPRSGSRRRPRLGQRQDHFRWRSRDLFGHQTQLRGLHACPPHTVVSAQPVRYRHRRGRRDRQPARGREATPPARRGSLLPGPGLALVRRRGVTVGPRHRHQGLASVGQHDQQLVAAESAHRPDHLQPPALQGMPRPGHRHLGHRTVPPPSVRT